MEITQKLVEKYFGDDFQCLYATRDNTERVHSHILFNSVSWRTEKKYSPLSINSAKSMVFPYRILKSVQKKIH